MKEIIQETKTYMGLALEDFSLKPVIDSTDYSHLEISNVCQSSPPCDDGIKMIFFGTLGLSLNSKVGV